jgi:hypothetical protein
MITLNALPANLQDKMRQHARALREGSLEQSLPAAFDLLDEVAAYQPGSGTSRLAEIAKKVGRDGDSTAAEMGGVTLLEDLGSLAGSVAPALQGLMSPIASVVGATFDTLLSAQGQNLIVAMAQTGLQALEAENGNSLPMAGGLAGEPFLIGIAEHRELNESAGTVCDFLQEEMPAMLVQPAREAYRSVLKDLSTDPASSESSLLAGAGYAALHAIPGKETSFIPLLATFAGELSSVENPFSAAVADEVADKIESYAKEQETAPMAVTLADALFTTLDNQQDPTTLEDASKLGQTWLGKIAALDIPATDRVEIAEAYFGRLSEEAGTPILEFGEVWLDGLSEEQGEARLAVMGALLKSTAEQPAAPPTAILGLTDGLAVDRPQVRDSALGALIAALAGELGRDELVELKDEPYSAEGLARKEQAIVELRGMLSQMAAEEGQAPTP